METKSIYPAELVLLIFALIAGLYVVAILINPQQSETTATAVRVSTLKPVVLPPLIAAPANLPPMVRHKPGRFRIVALPEGFTACAINNKSEVGGTWLGDPVGGLRSKETRAALWRKGKLRILPAWNNEPSYGATLSDASVIAGSAGSSWSGAVSVSEGDGILWYAAKNAPPLHIGHLPELSCAELYAINRRGHAVGFSYPSSMMESREGTQTQNAFVWDGRKLLDLGSGAAYGINERGQVVGRSENQIALWQGGGKRLLGQGEGRAINIRGQIVGVATFGRAQSVAVPDKPMHDKQTGRVTFATLPVSFATLPVSFPRNHALLWERGTRKDLGVLPGTTESEAVGINDQRQIVGNCTDPGDYKKQRAFLWQYGTMVDLNTLIALRSGWILREARSINNKGQIVGIGTFEGKERSYLLTPQ